MKIKNETHYETKGLRKIICRAINESIKNGEDRRTKNLHIKICYSRRGHSGMASIMGQWMLLRLPRELHKVSVKIFAQVVMHEYDHILGYKHDIIGRYVNDDLYDTAWLTDEYAIKEKTNVLSNGS